jgi:hypothetical protein
MTNNGTVKALESQDKTYNEINHFRCNNKSKRIPSIFKDESTRSCICLWKLAVAIATYVSVCIVYRILPSFAF